MLVGIPKRTLTDLECVLLLRRARIHRGRILPHLAYSLQRVVHATVPASVAGACGVLDGVDEAANGTSRGRSGGHGGCWRRRRERRSGGGLVFMRSYARMEPDRKPGVKRRCGITRTGGRDPSRGRMRPLSPIRTYLNAQRRAGSYAR
jgi:hypothetical protein